MSIFKDFFVKEKPVFTGITRGTGGFGFGSGGGGGVAAPDPISATGGNQSPSSGLTPGDGYIYHVFTSSGALTISSGEGDVDYFVVAGGGGGGNTIGGGGGGGGIARGQLSGMTPGPYTVTVGAGGPGSSGPGSAGNYGENSVFSTIVAAGGGGGGSEVHGPGTNGGSGGGGGHGGADADNSGVGNRYPNSSPTPADLRNQPVTPTPQGYDGGDKLNPGPSAYMAGGGGGAGEVGQDGQHPSTSGRGGAGINHPWVPTSYGDSGYFGGGGGGGADTPRSVGAGAGSPNGGGGAGSGGPPAGGAGTANTGGGGGGGSYTGGRPTGGAGGSGFVMVRYST